MFVEPIPPPSPHLLTPNIFTALLESFHALKSACDVDAASESLPLESITGHEDLFAAESPYALPLLSAAALVLLLNAYAIHENMFAVVILFLSQDVSAVLGLPLASASNGAADAEASE